MNRSRGKLLKLPHKIAVPILPSLKPSSSGAGKGRRACHYISGILNSTSNSPVAPHRLSCQISADQHEVEMSVNVHKHWRTCAKGNDVITVISTNQHFALTFSKLIFKFQRHSCKLSFLFLPLRQSAQEILLAGKKTTYSNCSPSFNNTNLSSHGLAVNA